MGIIRMKSKLAKYIIIFLVGFFALSFMLSWIYQDEIKKQLLAKANEQINARVHIENVSLSLITSFPQTELKVEGLHIIGKDEFKNDTLAKVESIELGISLWKYISSQTIQINDLQIKNAKINALVLPDGKANWDIIKPSAAASETSESKALDLQLTQYQLENTEIIYNDQSRRFFTHLKGVQHTGSGNFKEELFTLNSKTEVENWNLSFLGKPILSNVKASLEAPIVMNFKKMEFTFEKNMLLLNELPIHFTYRLAMPKNSMNMELNFTTENATVKNFLSLIPSFYSKQFDELQAAGNASLKGKLSGELTDTRIPTFDMQLHIENGSFSYANKPEKIHELYLGLKIQNQTGITSATTISIQPFDFSINQENIQSHLFIQNPMGDPALEGGIKGNIQLKTISQLFPQEGISYAGNLQADMQFKGTVNALKAGKGHVKGIANVRNFAGTFQEKSIQMPLIEGKFNANNLQVQSNFQYLETPFEVKGGISNVFGFFLHGEHLGSNLKLDIRNLDIKKAFEHFPIVKTYLPIAGNLIGTISPSFTFKGNFNQVFDVDLSSVSAEGILQTSDINGSGSAIFNQLLKTAKWKGANELTLKASKFNFVIQDGRLIFKPFNLPTSIGTFAVSGSNGLDQTLNYQIKTSLSSIGGIISKIPLEFNITGTVTKPFIKVGIFGNSSATEAAKEVIKTEIKKQKNLALEQAQKKADEELEKAQAIAEEIKSKAYAEADKLVEQAGNPLAKFAAKKLADQLKKEADKKVTKLLLDAHNRADEIIEKAKSEK